jgi:hypothetical protein
VPHTPGWGRSAIRLGSHFVRPVLLSLVLLLPEAINLERERIILVLEVPVQNWAASELWALVKAALT